MKKISILALHLATGGVENVITNISNMLSNDYDVEIISVYKIEDKPAFNIDSKVKITYLIQEAPNKDKLLNAIKNKNVILTIKEGLKSIKILYLRRKKSIQAIKNIETDIIVSSRYLFNRWVGKYTKNGTIKIAQEHNHHNNKKNTVKKIIRSLKHIDYFMPVSNELTEFYTEKLKNTNIKCVYIPNPLEYFPPEINNINTNQIISVGRLSIEKGFKDLIDVFEKMFNRNKLLKLHIVGDGQQKDYLKNYIKEKTLEENIILHGFLSKEQLNELYSKSDLYLMTSLTESFGLVLVEAESFGIPLIAFDSAQGAKEIINNGKNGYLIPNRDINLMSEQACELMENYNIRVTLGKNGRKMAEKYKKDEIYKIWRKFIESI